MPVLTLWVSAKDRALVERAKEQFRRRGSSLSKFLARQLRAELGPQPARSRVAPASRAPSTSDRSREMQWVKEHALEFAGLWVALEGGRLIASGPEAPPVFRAARAAGLKRPFVVRLDPPGTSAFGGW